MNRWVHYKNGNYIVHLDTETGTKIRENDLDYFEADTVESIDLKLTNKCDMGCPFCHEASTSDGAHADLFAPSFLDNLHPYTEIAIGGGNPLSHPDLLKFLIKCKEKQFIPSMTVNQVHFESNFEFIKQLVNAKLIYGVGISLNYPSDDFLDKVSQIPNAVIHIIAGTNNSHRSYLELMKDRGLKILILGFKKVRKGDHYYDCNEPRIETDICLLKKYLPEIMGNNWFEVISFDNLALQQLDIRSMMDEDDFNFHYMGDDGIEGSLTSSSMFIDLVERKFAKNSCSMERYDLMDTIEQMYSYLKNKDFYEDLHAEQTEQM